MSILVLGLGNILLSDEGVGVRIVEALDAAHELPSDVDLLDAALREWTCWTRSPDATA